MFQNFSYFLSILVIAVTFHHVLPPYWPRLRQISATIFSLIIILIISPISLVLALSVFGVVYAYILFFKIISRAKVYTYLFSIIIISFTVFAKYYPESLGALEVIGISYVMLKALSVIWMVRWKNYKVDEIEFFDVLLLILFFPIFSAGPIERPKVFLEKNFARSFDVEDIGIGFYRIVLGIFKAHFVAGSVLAPIILKLGPVDGMSSSVIWVYIWLKFLALYVGFSGYSDLAIGSGRLFGIKIVENFNMPFISGSIREFWTRWHISLGNFVNSFMFFPLVKMLRGRVEISIFLSFVLVGLWHNLSWNYFIWGVGHGGLLALYFFYDKKIKKKKDFNKFRKSSKIWRCVAIVGTVSYISALSVFANSPDLETGISVLKRALFI